VIELSDTHTHTHINENVQCANEKSMRPSLRAIGTLESETQLVDYNGM